MYLQAETEFGLNFLTTLPVNESVVFSPISIALALAILHVGARGNSRDQIRDVLLNGTTYEQFIDHFSFMNKNINQTHQRVEQYYDWDSVDAVKKNRTVGVEVLVANRVYLKKYFTIKPEFLSTSRQRYNADAKILPSSVADAVAEIDSFVNASTKGKINKIAQPDMIENCVVIIVNAIYFKGDWQSPFEVVDSRNKMFTTVSGQLIEMQFMIKNEENLEFSSDDVFDVLHLLYKISDFKLSIFLPKQKNSLNQALKSLKPERFQMLLSDTSRTLLHVELPKFKIETKLDNLVDNLKALGLTDIFKLETADLSGIARNIYVGKGIHKAIIEVDERGTVAAAVTIFGIEGGSYNRYVPSKPKDFIANHPFLYTLSYQNHPVFMGVFNK